jgi:hypothetical protein
MQQTMRRALAACSLMSVVLLGTACSDNSTSPGTAQVAGSYRATTFTATSALGTENVLQTGGSLTAQFATSGAVTGHVTIPSEAVDEDFVGTWKIENGEVDIEEVPSDIFVEDMSFKIAGTTLVADDTFDGVRVQVVLTKQ